VKLRRVRRPLCSAIVAILFLFRKVSTKTDHSQTASRAAS
jgi:hypothetical protein